MNVPLPLFVDAPARLMTRRKVRESAERWLDVIGRARRPPPAAELREVFARLVWCGLYDVATRLRTVYAEAFATDPNNN